MREETLKYCELLVKNRDVFREAFMWEDGLKWLAGAGVFTMNDQLADVDTLKQCKKMIAQKAGMFSNFSALARVPVTAMLAVSGYPDKLLDKGLEVYKRLKQDFISSSYLPMAAMIIAQMTGEQSYEETAVRTKTLYRQIRSKHPFLTNSEDSPLCALMAFSEKSDDELISDMEKCYRILKQEFIYDNAVQSLTHVLALFEEPAELKCEKTMQLFHGLKEAGMKYGVHYELPTLGVLAMTNVPLKVVIQEMAEIDEWLSRQKGFGFWSNVTPKQRLLYAGILAQKDYIKVDTMQAAAIGSVVAMILAQEMLLMTMFICSVALANSHSSAD